MGTGDMGDLHARQSPSAKQREACCDRRAIHSLRFCGRQMGAPPHESAVSFLKKTAQLGNGRRGKSMTAITKEGKAAERREKAPVTFRADAPGAWDHAAQEGPEGLARGRHFALDLVSATQTSAGASGGGSGDGSETGGARAPGVAAFPLAERSGTMRTVYGPRGSDHCQLAAMASCVGSRLAI